MDGDSKNNRAGNLTADPLEETVAVSAEPTPAPAPPTPGRVDVTISGAYEARIDGEGTICVDDGFRVLSSDVYGFRSTPTWSLGLFRGRLHFRAGSISVGTAYFNDSALELESVRAVDDGFVLDVDLASRDGSASVRIVGAIGCPSTADENRVPEAVVELLEDASGGDVRRYSTFDFGRQQDRRSISAIVPEQLAVRALSAVRGQLPPGFVAFIGTTRWLVDEHHAGVELVVGPGVDQFDAVRLAHSEAVNYELMTEALVKELRAVHSETPIDIVLANTDSIRFLIPNPPPDARELAEQLYEFCPDAVDQGLGSLEALSRAIVDEGQVHLWWD